MPVDVYQGSGGTGILTPCCSSKTSVLRDLPFPWDQLHSCFQSPCQPRTSALTSPGVPCQALGIPQAPAYAPSCQHHSCHWRCWEAPCWAAPVSPLCAGRSSLPEARGWLLQEQLGLGPREGLGRQGMLSPLVMPWRDLVLQLGINC